MIFQHLTSVLCFYFLHLQLTWSPRSITIMWRRRGRRIQPVDLRVPLTLLCLQQRPSQRTPSPRATQKLSRSPPETPARHTRKYRWHFSNLSWLRTTHMFIQAPTAGVCSHNWSFPSSLYRITNIFFSTFTGILLGSSLLGKLSRLPLSSINSCES